MLTETFKSIHEEEENHNKKNLKIIDYKGTKIIIRKNDVTQEMTDAIVNPSDEQLKHHDDIAKTIADKAGDKFDEEWKEYIENKSLLPPGKAIITSAGGSLFWKYIINIVGLSQSKNPPKKFPTITQLKTCIENILKLTIKHQIQSVSIPAIFIHNLEFSAEKCAKYIGNEIKSLIDK